MKSSKYFIDYIYSNTTGANFYHQLVRRSDNAILYANANIEFVYAECFKRGILNIDVITL